MSSKLRIASPSTIEQLGSKINKLEQRLPYLQKQQRANRRAVWGQLYQKGSHDIDRFLTQSEQALPRFAVITSALATGIGALRGSPLEILVGLSLTGVSSLYSNWAKNSFKNPFIHNRSIIHSNEQTDPLDGLRSAQKRLLWVQSRIQSTQQQIHHLSGQIIDLNELEAGQRFDEQIKKASSGSSLGQNHD